MTEPNPLLVDEFNVGGVVHESSLSDDLYVDRADLSAEFEQHASKFAWYSTAYEIAVDHESRMKARLDRAYAVLDVQVRAAMEAANVKVTEKKVENTVINHEEYRALQEEYFDAKLQVGLLKAARDAMIHKKECLISLGANIRAELSSNPSILQESYRTQFGNNQNK